MENKDRFKLDSKVIVDTLFDTQLFREDITRDEMITTEELIQYMMSSRFDSQLKANKLFESINVKQVK